MLGAGMVLAQLGSFVVMKTATVDGLVNRLTREG
jgi:hypothetical protein